MLRHSVFLPLLLALLGAAHGQRGLHLNDATGSTFSRGMPRQGRHVLQDVVGGCFANNTCPDPSNCCSQFNFCGTDADHCGAGCKGGPCLSNSTASAPPPGACSATQPCPDATNCCSRSGFCGSTADYCGVGCLAGPCLPNASSISPAPPPNTPSLGACNASRPCPDPTHCCSQFGFCGSTADYCSAGCVAGPCFKASGSNSSGSAAAASQSDSGGGSNHSKAGMIAGIVVGVAVLVALVSLAVWLWRRKSSSKYSADAGSSVPCWPGSPRTAMTADGDVGIMADKVKNGFFAAEPANSLVGLHGQTVYGLMPGDVFLKATADQYRWTSYLPGSHSQFVEQENEETLDQWAGITHGAVAVLSKSEVAENIELLTDGLLGKGATAYVFACQWKKRFGEHSLLACKVMTDGYHPEPYVPEAFAYEAGVLASIRHPNVVRLYGYCLEPPCVCLILELLPSSLKSALYPERTQSSALFSQSWNSLRASERLSTVWPSSSRTRAGSVQPPTERGPLTTSTLSRFHTAQTALSPATALPPATVETFSTAVGNGTEMAGKGGGGEAVGSGGVGEVVGRDGGGETATTNGGEVVVRQVAGAEQHEPAPSTCSADWPLSMLEVLRISADIAAGLAHLHNQPVAVAPHHRAPGRPKQGMEVIKETSLLVMADGVIKDATELTYAGPSMDGVAPTARVVHRDLKPANILLASNGTARISDFGLARQTYTTTLHTVSKGAGTLPYMAPELVAARLSHNKDELRATSRVDVYSFSMIMWELLARKHPWQGRAEMEILAAVASGFRPELPTITRPQTDTAMPEPRDLSQVPAGFDVLPTFNQVITEAWQQQPEQRPTAAQLRDKLQSLYAMYEGLAGRV